jgi:two-component system, repressor protein LuxO
MTDSSIASLFPGLRVLVVEDLVALAIQYKTISAKLGVQVTTAGTVAQAKRHIPEGPWHAALVDLNLPDGTGFDVMQALLKAHPACSVVVITAEDSLDNAVRASEAGAFDFIEKPVEAERLLVTLRNALHASLLTQQVASLQTEAPRQFEQFHGHSAAMQTIYKMIDTVAQSNAPVCITGESGTGKELAANAIHARSPRKSKNLVAINCAAIPKELIESELFGHARGAFTGAVADRQGVFIEADKGTLFLDEIAELDLAVQAKLLRVLQTGEVKRLGEDKTRIVDVRIVCATHRNLQERVRQGEFREDLFYRLYVVPIDLPPLRERGDDVVLIARKLLTQYAREDGRQFTDFSADALAALTAHNWPGNVRELINVVRAAVALHDGKTVELAMLPDSLTPKTRALAQAGQPFAEPAAAMVPRPPTAHTAPDAAPAAAARPLPFGDAQGEQWFSQPPYADAAAAPAPSIASMASTAPAATAQPGGAASPANAPTFDRKLIRPLDQVEREAVDYALRAFGGNVAKAARALQVNPSTLYRKIQGWTAQDSRDLEPAA